MSEPLPAFPPKTLPPHSKQRLSRSYRADWDVRRPAIMESLEQCREAAADEQFFRQRQDRLFVATIQNAFRNSLYYRRRFDREKVQTCQGLEDLGDFPFLNRQQVQQNLEGIAAKGLGDFSSCGDYSTSGSTGQPIVVLRGREAVLYDTALLRLIAERYGVPQHLAPTRPSLFFLQQNTWSLEERMPLLSMGRFYRFPLGSPTWDTPEHLLAFLSSHPGVILSSNPQSLTQLMDLIQAEDPNAEFPILPSMILSGGSELSDTTRERIQRVFAAPLVNVYATVEAGIVGIQCPRSLAFHVESSSIVECIDTNGHTVGPGQAGELVHTDLRNPHFPIIRYRSGDFGIVSKGKCECGSVLPRIDALLGRTSTLFRTRSGQPIIPGTMNRQLRNLPVYQYQLEQCTLNRFILRYRALPDVHKLEEHIFTITQRCLQLHFGEHHLICEAAPRLGLGSRKEQGFICSR